MHNVENALAAAGVAHVLGFDVGAIAGGLTRSSAPPGRFERVHAGTFDAFVDYAHTEDGLERALAVARAIAKGRVIIVLGCGGDRDATKRPGMGRIASEHADLAVFTTDNPRSEDPARIVEEMLGGVARPDRVRVVMDREEALRLACAEAGPGDVVLATGKGVETYQEIAGVRHPFAERDILRAAARAADTKRGAS
jgi:UDP-N-acetylmuramoyl-L-alanyl-D-glutamate--2,6-diaminopimelate ligase